MRAYGFADLNRCPIAGFPKGIHGDNTRAFTAWKLQRGAHLRSGEHPPAIGQLLDIFHST